jgi:outer membrane protein assembly factor BamB
MFVIGLGWGGSAGTETDKTMNCRMLSRLVAAVPACMILTLAAGARPSLAADRTSNTSGWPGWRGAEREGRADGTEAPLHWSPDENVRWETAIPGEGHSSPIVWKDAIYLTAGYYAERSSWVVFAFHGLSFLLALLLAALTVDKVVRSSRSLPDDPAEAAVRIAALVLLLFTVSFTCGLVLFGESFFAFRREADAAWPVSSMFLGICLLLSVVGTPSRARVNLVVGVSGLVIGAITLLGTLNERLLLDRTESKLLSVRSLVIVLMTGLPAVVGGMLLLRRRFGERAMAWLAVIRKGRAPRMLGVAAAVLLVGVAIIKLAVLENPAAEESDGFVASDFVSSYEPVLAFRTVLVVAALLALAAAIRRIMGNSPAGNVPLVFGIFLFMAVSGGWVGERIISRSPYFMLRFESRQFTPILGSRAVVVLLAGVAISVLVSVLTAASRTRVVRGLVAGSYLPTALALGLVGFLGSNLVSADMEYVRAIVCVDRDSGRIRWKCEALPGQVDKCHRDNSAATPTPATDGERVYAYFGTPGFMCADVDGRLLWTNDDIPYDAYYGIAISPVTAGGHVFLHNESKGRSYILALDKRTGREMWRKERKRFDFASGINRTPLTRMIAGRPTLLVWGYEDLAGYDPKTGKQLFSHHIPHQWGDSVASMVSDSERLYLPSPRATTALALDKLAGSGSPVVWHREFTGSNCSSPVVVNGLLFLVTDAGKLTCADAGTGDVLWQTVLKGKHYSSLVAVGDLLYVSNVRGTTTVFRCSPTIEKLAENRLPGGLHASLVPVDGTLLIRTFDRLYCVESGGRSRGGSLASAGGGSAKPGPARARADDERWE